MLDALRTKKWKTRLMWATLILVVPGFVAVTGSIGGDEFSNILRLFGFNVGEPQYAVKVAGVAVSQREYMDTRKNILQNYLRMYQQADANQIEKMIDIDRQTMNSLIQNILLNREAEKEGLFVSEQEILQYITSSPMFIDETKHTFSKAKYRRYLNYLQMSEAQFEAEVHKQLLMDKLQTRVQNDIIIPENEIKREFNSKYEEVKVDYIKIDPNKFIAKAEISDEDINAYYEEHKEEYKTWEKMTIDYVEFNVADYQDKVEITDEMIAGYIDSNEDKYKIPLQFNIEHFTIADNDYEAIATAGATEEKLKAYYEDNKQEFETSEQFVIDYVYMDRSAMQADYKVTEEEKKEYYKNNIQRYTEDEKITARIILISTEKHSDSEAEVLINKAADRLRAGEDFAKVAMDVSEDAASKTKGGLLSMMDRRGFSFKFRDNKLADAAFSLQQGEVSDPILSANGYYLMTVDERKEKVVRSYEDSAKNVEESIKQQRSNKEADEISQKIVDAVTAGKTIREAAAEQGLEVYTSNPFRQGEKIDARLGTTASNFARRNLFSDEKVKVGDVFGPEKTATATLTIQIKEKNPPIVPEYGDAIREKVKSSWIEREKGLLQKSRVESFIKSVEEGEATFDEAFEKINKELGNKKTTAFTGLFRVDAQEIPTIKFRNEQEKQALITDLKRSSEGMVGSAKSFLGISIYQIVERKEAYIPEFDELKEEVAAVLKEQEAGKLAEKEAFAFRNKIDEMDGNFDAAAKDAGLEILTTGSFERASAAPLIGASNDVTGWVLSGLELGDISDVLTDRSNENNTDPTEKYYILKYKDKVEPQVKPLSEVKHIITSNLKRDKAYDMAEVAAKNIELDIENGVTLEKIADSNKVSIETTEPFSRKDEVAGLGADTEFTFAAFNLQKVGDVSGVINVNDTKTNTFDGYYVLRLAEKTAPDKDYEEERQNILNTIENQYSSNFQREWIDNLVKKADDEGIIKRNEYLIERAQKRRASLRGEI